jgi:hypothetical protein
MDDYEVGFQTVLVERMNLGEVCEEEVDESSSTGSWPIEF